MKSIDKAPRSPAGSGTMSFWTAVNGWSRVLVLAAVFCQFAAFGLMALQGQLVRFAIGAMIGIVVAYNLMIHFFRAEGKRYFEMRTEMALAKEIHDSLVPVCATSIAGFEIYGASVPSGEVGGDLVDVVERPGEWTGYVADVSGHGVRGYSWRCSRQRCGRRSCSATLPGASCVRCIELFFR